MEIINDIHPFVQAHIRTFEHSKMVVEEPAMTVLENGFHKQLINTILEIFNYWFKLTDRQFRIAKDSNTLLYMTLIIKDDMEDHTELRDRIKSAYSVYGYRRPNNCVFYFILLSLKKIAIDYKDIPFVKRVIDDINYFIMCGNLQMYWKDSGTVPTEEEYTELIIRKGSYCPKLVVGLAQYFSQDTRDFKKLFELFSFYIYLRNDCCNLWSNVYAQDYGFASHISEGKMSFPIIWALNNGPKEIKEELRNLLRQAPTDISSKKRCISLIEQCGTLEYCKKKLEKIETELRKEIQALGGNPKFDEFLDKFKDWEYDFNIVRIFKLRAYDELDNIHNYDYNHSPLN